VSSSKQVEHLPIVDYKAVDRHNDVLRALDESGYCIVKGYIPAKTIKKRLKQLRKNFSGKQDIRISGPCYHMMPNFQRLDLGDYEQDNARFCRMITQLSWNSGAIFKKECESLIKFRNKIVGKKPDKNFIYQHNNQDHCDLAKILNYPAGGGFMNEHLDSYKNFNKVLNVLLSLTKRGIDFERGGVYYIDKQEKFIDAEAILEPGDLYMHTPATKHGVKAIDPHKNIDLENLTGRVCINLSFEHFEKAKLT
jgi:hypothetical protein